MLKKRVLGLITVLLVFMLPLLVQAQPLPFCGDSPSVSTNCVFVTPSLNCTDAGYTYDIFNVTGQHIVTRAQLQNFSGNLYQFNFTLVSGVDQYVIELCDGTTREVFVGGNDMSVPTIVEGQIIFFVIMIILTFLFLFISLKFEDPVFGFVSGSLFLFIGWLIFDNPFLFSTSAGAAVFGTSTFIGLTAFGIMVMLLGVYVLFSSVQMFFSKKKGEGIQPNQRFEPEDGRNDE